MEAPHGSHAFRKGSERAVVVGGFGGVEQPDGKVKKKKRGGEEEGAEDDTRADGSCTVLLNTEDKKRNLERRSPAVNYTADQKG